MFRHSPLQYLYSDALQSVSEVSLSSGGVAPVATGTRHDRALATGRSRQHLFTSSVSCFATEHSNPAAKLTAVGTFPVYTALQTGSSAVMVKRQFDDEPFEGATSSRSEFAKRVSIQSG